MALATKCPHCNTIFRVAHDQLKLRGGIVRCGACNEVFDGNAALIQPQAAPSRSPSPASPVSPVPASPLPPPQALDAKLDALDHRAAALHDDDLETIHTLQLETGDDTEPAAAAPAARLAPWEDEVASDAPADQAEQTLPDAPLSAADFPPPAALPEFDLDFDLDLPPVEDEHSAAAVLEEPAAAVSTLAASETPVHLPVADEDEPIDLDIASMSDTELEAALQAELAAIDAAEEELKRETAAALEAEAEAEAEALVPAPALTAADMLPPALDGRREPTLGDIDHDPLADAIAADTLAASKAAAHHLDDDDDDDDDIDADEEAMVQLSAAGVAHAGGAPAHTLGAQPEGDDSDLALAEAPHTLQGAPAADAQNDDAVLDEPGFVKRDRRRQRFSKVATIVMAAGSVLLVGALAAQILTTFRNTLAASVPALKPALSAACAPLGCRIELPTQIESVTIEQGELQSLSETTFSFTTLLRNQSASAQAWPHIELVLDDDKDKAILRRVFAPADYLAPGGEQAALVAQGFAPHSEQSVKLYFELKQLKASGYHIAVFYP